MFRKKFKHIILSQCRRLEADQSTNKNTCLKFLFDVTVLST